MMTGKGLAKLIEECGELTQVAGKRLAYYTTDEHPDGGPPLPQRLEEEISDVLAACLLVSETHGLDAKKIQKRMADKLALFHEWHAKSDNNQHGIDTSKTGDKSYESVKGKKGREKGAR